MSFSLEVNTDFVREITIFSRENCDFNFCSGTMTREREDFKNFEKLMTPFMNGALRRFNYCFYESLKDSFARNAQLYF